LSPAPARHSGLGIASFVIGLVAAVVVFLALLAAGVLSIAHGGAIDQRAPAVILVGLVMVLFLLIAFIGIVLGLIGVLQARRRKLFAGLGLGINAAVVIGTLALIMLGHSLK
jgi:hypothetical protein